RRRILLLHTWRWRWWRGIFLLHLLAARRWWWRIFLLHLLHTRRLDLRNRRRHLRRHSGHFVALLRVMVMFLLCLRALRRRVLRRCCRIGQLLDAEHVRDSRLLGRRLVIGDRLLRRRRRRSALIGWLLVDHRPGHDDVLVRIDASASG